MENSPINGGEATLIRRIRSGDKRAFEELYRSHYSNLCDFVFRYVDMPAVCEDLVQNLFVDIWRKRQTWNPKGGVRPYLYKAARNRALDHLKHRKVERNYIEYQKSILEGEPAAAHFVPSPDQQLFQKQRAGEQELENALMEAVERLPDRRKTIFLLSRKDGLTYREIAGVLDVSVQTVDTQMHRTLKMLREHLSDFFKSA